MEKVILWVMVLVVMSGLVYAGGLFLPIAFKVIMDNLFPKPDPPTHMNSRQFKKYSRQATTEGLEQVAERPFVVNYDSEINRIEWGDWSDINEMQKS